jgi:hypothetical protein
MQRMQKRESKGMLTNPLTELKVKSQKPDLIFSSDKGELEVPGAGGLVVI